MVLGFYCRGKVLRATVDPSTNSNIATQTHNSLALYRETVAGFKVHPVEGLELQVRLCNAERNTLLLAEHDVKGGAYRNPLLHPLPVLTSA